MFTRVQRIKRRSGQVDEYVQILETYREGRRVRQRVIANLGNKQVLWSQYESLVKILNPSLVEELEAIEPQVAAPYGVSFVVHHLFEELGLWEALDGCSKAKRFADYVAVLVTNRLSAPGSEHRLGGWLEAVFVGDRSGGRFLPVWKTSGRVKVDLKWLSGFYRALDILEKNKKKIEKGLYLSLRDLFHLKVEVVFYDLTSTYFEGRGPEGLAEYGYSRDGRPGNRQVLVGMVMVQGLPIAHHVFEGNRVDHKTVEEVIEDLERRFEIERMVFVGDRGMVTVKTLSCLKSRGHGYLMGLVRRRREDIQRYITMAKGEGRECPVGITASEKKNPPKTRVWEVSGQEPSVRVLVVHSEEREAYERAMRERSMERVRQELDSLQRRVEAGKLKSREKIGAAAARILSRHHGSRYFDWRLTEEGRFQYFEHPVHLEQEKQLEGKYVIQTEELELDAVEGVQQYKELSEVERGFRSLKDIQQMRPIYHQTDHRVRAHVFVAVLAFLLERVLEKKLKATQIPLSAPEALQALQTISVVEFDVQEIKKMGVTPGSARARAVLKALGVSSVPSPSTLLTKKRPM